MEESQVSHMLRRTAFILALVLSVCSLAGAQSSPIVVNPGRSLNTPPTKPPEPPPEPAGTVHLKPSDLDSRQPLTDGTRLQLIRVMAAEFAHVRKYFPVG